MSGDYSRWSFDPARHFGAVLMQQGRVHTDADFNEWVAMILRRVGTGTLDVIGQAAVPRETPEGFGITMGGGTFTIGPGRMYVDGLLAENDGDDPVWDPHVAELRGTTPIPYDKQPYWPAPDPLPAGGPHLVYVKVWRRELTAVERPKLIEQALGVDTTTRLQTAWQVKVAENIDPAVTCSTALSDIPEFVAAEPLAGGRLTTGTADVAGQDDPCLVPPTGGYKGLENQLYRVEIHDGGDLAQATFKWSRENASVAARVTAIPALDRIVVDRLGRDDATLGFSDGDWIEITDDERELAGLPGELRRIETAGGVETATNSIHLSKPLPNGLFPVDAQGNTADARNTRIRRWDQAGRVLDADDNELVDLDGAAAAGTIPITGAPVQIVLEDGIVVSFTLDAAGGAFRTGDYWVFAARTADASVEELAAAPPLGIHAHFAKLAIVTFPGTLSDCRVLWPPPDQVGEGGGDGCECTVCVTPESHESGQLTIQDAIEAVKERGGTVCLEAGTYPVKDTVRIEDARSVRLHGQGLASVIVMAGTGTAVRVQQALDVRIDNLAIVSSNAREAGGIDVVQIADAIDVTLRECFVLGVPVEDGEVGAVGLADVVVGCRIERCALAGNGGVVGGRPRNQDKPGLLITAALRIEDNWMWCTEAGVIFMESCLHLMDTTLRENVIWGCAQMGIGCFGANAAGPFDVSANVVRSYSHGIALGVDRARVVGNDLTGLTKRKPEGEELGGHRPRGSGVFVQPGLSPAPIDIEVLDNRLDRFGYGIGITRPLGAATLARNLITRMSVGGIAMSQDATAVQLAIHDNQLREIAAAEDDTEGDLAAIRVVGVVDLGLARNSLLGFATKAIKATAREAIVVVAGADSRVSDNHLADIGPPREYSGGATGIRFVGWLQTAGVHQNSIARTSDASLEPEFSGWSGIDVLGVDGDPEQPDMWAAAGDAAVFVLKSRAVLLTATHAHQFHHTRGQGDVAITGNEIVAGATHERPLNVGLVRGCRLVGNRLQSIPRAVSLVWCRRAIVCNNDIRSEETEALNIRLDDQKEAAVVANVTTGEILLNGNSLPSPYHDLNPRVFD